jgi:flagellar biosynthesis/type III secretory pathway protein FliH
MASWLIPTLKAVLPHVGDIVASALPVFRRKAESGAADLVQQQIAELQAAVGQNAGHVHELAAQLQSTVAALEQAAAHAEARLRRAVVLSAVACALAVVALFAALMLR